MQASLSPTFRYAENADVERIVALVESAYRGPSGERGWTTESALLGGQRTDAQEVRDLLHRADCHLLLAERAGALLASCHLERRGHAGYFGMFAVDPLAQGAGLGKSMLAWAERLAQEEWGCHDMRMTVIEQRSELIAWYARRGYQETGEYEPFPYGDERFGIPRRPDLRFVVLAKHLTAGETCKVG
jgi:GNAT superfamily N-acetyltransferase